MGYEQCFDLSKPFQPYTAATKQQYNIYGSDCIVKSTKVVAFIRMHVLVRMQC